MTLLDLMYAAGVLALALSLLFGSLMSLSVIGQLSESRTQAAAHVASVLEEVRRLPLEGIVAYTPPEFYGPGVERAVNVGFYNANGELVALPVGEDVPAGLPNPLQVRAEFIWSDDRGRLYSVQAVTNHGR